MKSGKADEHTLERMERYVMRVEQYVEAMSSVQRLEQIQVRLCDTDVFVLREELEETARMLAPGLHLILSVPDFGMVRMDHGDIFDGGRKSDRKCRAFCLQETGD